MDITAICGLTASEIFQVIEPFGYRYDHATTISNNIYKKRISDISQFPAIPVKLKNILISMCSAGIVKPVFSQVSADNTIKYLFRTGTGKEYEAVYIPDGKRSTVCVSTQSGCRMGCSFCLTASYGFRGNLTAGEIVNQILSVADADRVTHVVFMGMGEPLDNIDNVLKACEIVTAEWGLSVSSANVTVSTVGISSGVNKYLRSNSCNLTLSLHTPFPDERKMIVPAEHNSPANEVLEIIKSYPSKKKRRFSIAYLMIKGFNDTDRHLAELIRLIKNSRIRVNLIPYNPVSNDINISSTPDRMQYFKHKLVLSGISASIRKSRGADISAACGLLAVCSGTAQNVTPC